MYNNYALESIYKYSNFYLEYYFEKYYYLDVDFSLSNNNILYLKLKYLIINLKKIHKLSSIDYKYCVILLLIHMYNQNIDLFKNYYLECIINNLFKEFLNNKITLNKNLKLLLETLEYLFNSNG